MHFNYVQSMQSQRVQCYALNDGDDDDDDAAAAA